MGRLEALMEATRVDDHRSRENLVPGLIDLCRKYIRPWYYVVEVGSFAGVSTEVLALHLPRGKLWAVDPQMEDGGRMSGAANRLREMAKRYPRLKLLRLRSPEAAAGFNDHSLDLVYIDAGHSREEVMADVAAWTPKVRPGGILAGHDYHLVGGFLGFTPDEVFSEESWVRRLG